MASSDPHLLVKPAKSVCATSTWIKLPNMLLACHDLGICRDPIALLRRAGIPQACDNGSVGCLLGRHEGGHLFRIEAEFLTVF
jgi:hypothetical protein